MKKTNKIIVFITVLTIMLGLSVVKCNAETSIIPRVLKSGVKSGDVYKFTTEKDGFDFSKVVFSTATPEKTISGMQGFKKIYNICAETTEECKFTPYCLNGNKKYPEYANNYADATVEPIDTNKLKLLFQDMTVAKVLQLCKEKNCTLFNDDITTISFDPTDVVDAAKLEEFTGLLNDNPDGITVSFPISNLLITKKGEASGTFTTLSASDICGGIQKTLTDDKCIIEFNPLDFDANKYNYKSNMTEEKLSKILWIIEHSYPNFDAEIALQMAGVSLQEFKDAITTIDNTANNTNIDTYVSNYLYAITQYAIWYVDGYYEYENSDKLVLGNQITNSTLFDKIYKFYIEGSANQGAYAKTALENTIKVVEPEKGKELKEKTEDYSIYGPYTITSDVLFLTKNIELSVKTPSSGVTITDLIGNPITKLTFDAKDSSKNQYLVKIAKDVDPAGVKISLKSDDAYVFGPGSRGAVFESESPIDQLVAIGGLVQKASVTTEHGVFVNVKTGVRDVTIMLIAAFSAFVAGYAVLKYKGSPVKDL